MAEALFEVDQAAVGVSRPEGEGGEPAILLRVHVQPAAGRASVVGRHGDALHVRVAAPPVGGRANDAAGELIADVFDVKRSQVELVSGERSREKRFRVAGVAPEAATRILDEAIEQAARRGGAGGGRSARRS